MSKKYNPTASQILCKLIRRVRTRKVESKGEEVRRAKSGHYTAAIHCQQEQLTCNSLLNLLRAELNKIKKGKS